ncbi:TetR family transcriptional regulator [Actinosynnema pretiosum]|uniref:TetR family transcriptional regulator n=2 Tax=Actinosynnema pretiosum TaxID=42197 RepID=A0A290Z722_9PSEU|nr:TetR family transcriptional regulator [Actinosynnema pretiosum]
MANAEGPRRRMSHDARHSQLLEEARLLIREEGCDALTLARVADRAGVAKPLVYQHFGTRAAVLVELYRRFEERQLAVLRELLATAEGDLRSVAEQIADASVGCAVTEGEELPGVISALEGSPELRRVRQEADRRFSDACLEALLPHARADGLPAAAMPAILGAMGGVSRGLVAGECTPDEGREALREVIAALVPGGG